MPIRYFTHYWKNSTWKNNAITVSPVWRGKKAAGKLSHTAGNLFRSKGVTEGDVVYVITVIDGELRLGGKLVVEKVMGKKQAAAYLEIPAERMWDGKDQLLMSTRTAKYFTPLNKVKKNIVEELQFKSSNGFRPVKFYPDGRIHEQTLRGVCELTETSAKLLDKSLGEGDKYPQW